jgi:hypothetical protein
MCVPVAGDFVPASDKLACEIGITLDRHPQEEERHASTQLVGESKDRLGLTFQCGSAPVPVGEPEAAVDELVPVLEVDAEQHLGHGANSKIEPLARLVPTVVVVALLGATAAAFAFSERLKLEDSPIRSTKIDRLFSPVCRPCRPEAREAEIRFRLGVEDHVIVDVVDRSGAPVRKALLSARLRPGAIRVSWDGRDERGRVVGEGLYRVRVTLDGEDRTLEFPDEIRVDSTAPSIEAIDVHPRVFSPDGDRRSDRVAVSYRFGEQAYAVLYLDGRRLSRSFRRRPVGTTHWYARRNGRPLPPGTHRLALAAQDVAGNMSPSTREFTVRVRYVELARERYRVRSTQMFRVRVSTDASRLTYTIGRRTVRLDERRSIRRFWVRAPQRPGRYLLTVRVSGRLDRALVIVRR